MKKNKNKLKNKANDLFSEEKYIKAGKLYEEIYNIDPHSELTMLLTAARSYELAGDKEKAIKTFIKVSKEFAENGFFLKATATLKNVLELDPHHKDIQQLISDLYAKNGNIYDSTSKSLLIKKDSFIPDGEIIEDDESTSQLIVTGKLIKSGDNFRKKDITDLDIKEPGKNKKLAEIPLFSELDKDVFIDVINKMKLKKYRDKSLIIKEGDKADAFYIISEGEVRVTKEIEDEEVELAILKKGSFFGEMAILGDAKRTASIEAKGEVELLILSRETLKELVKKYTSVKTTLYRFYQNRLLYNVINASPFFKGLKKDDKLGLLKSFLSQKVDSETMLIEQDGESTGIFIIVDGNVNVYRTLEDGKKQDIANISRGGILGEMSLLTGEKPTAYCITKSKTWFLRLPPQDFAQIKEFYPSIIEYLEDLKSDRVYELDLLEKLHLGLY